MKDRKIEDDMKYHEQKVFKISLNKFYFQNISLSAISNKIDDEFDLEIPTYFKDNQSAIDNKTVYSTNSLLNANLSNISNTVLGKTNQAQSIYNYNKNFFDTTTLNNINGSPHGSISSNCSI